MRSEIGGFRGLCRRRFGERPVGFRGPAESLFRAGIGLSAIPGLRPAARRSFPGGNRAFPGRPGGCGVLEGSFSGCFRGLVPAVWRSGLLWIVIMAAAAAAWFRGWPRPAGGGLFLCFRGDGFPTAGLRPAGGQGILPFRPEPGGGLSRYNVPVKQRRFFAGKGQASMLSSVTAADFCQGKGQADRTFRITAADFCQGKGQADRRANSKCAGL